MVSRRVGLQLLIVGVIVVALIRVPGDRARSGSATRSEKYIPAARLRTPDAIERAFEEGFYATAEAAARELLTRTENAHGPIAPQTADALDLVVRCLAFGPTAHDVESGRLAERAVTLKRRLYGPDDPRVAISVTYQAALYEATGAASQAESLYAYALALTERAFGPQHLLHVVVIREFLPLLNQIGQYERALELSERALRILAVAPDSTHLAHIQNARMMSYYQLGDYVRALDSIDEAIAIRESLFGPDHNRVQGLVNNRAIILHDMGDEMAALETYQRILESLRQTLDSPHDFRIGAALVNVGILELETGDLDGARRDLHAALEFATRRDRENQELAAHCLLGLGRLYYELGDDEDSESYYKQALDVCETALPTGHALIVAVLRRLAELYYEQGRLDLADQLCARADSTLVTTVGSEHPLRADIQTVWGRVLAAAHAADAAIEKSLSAEIISADHLGLMARGFAEREALLYARRRPHALDVPLRLVAKGAQPASVRRVWDAVVRSRALVREEMQARSRRATLAGDETTVRLVANLRRASTRAANLAVRGPGSDRQRHRALLEAAQREREAAERALAARSAEFRRDLELDRADLDEVAAHLPPGSALVAFVVYDRNERQGRSGAAAEAQHEASVLAFVLKPGRDPRIVRIGLRREIEALVAAWNREAAYGVLLRSRTAAASAAAYGAAGDALRRLVWDPVERLLGAARTVFVVPEGSLHLVSFAALPTAQGGYLLESGWRFVYFTAERDAIPRADRHPRNVGLLAIGDVDFKAPPAHEIVALRSSADAAARPVPGTTRGASLNRGGREPPCSPLAGLEATALPGTAVEVRQVSDIWKRSRGAAAANSEPLTILAGTAATEDAFVRLATDHRVLHIATHAFFLRSGCANGGHETIRTRQLRPLALPLRAGSEPSHERPPSLSGFFLAGAAHRNEAPLDRYDGVVTAEEIAVLDLQGVEFAVLSGCDTGVGDVHVGEGVHGLRRAFHIAGASSVVMSLWAVSDHAAQEWMTALYKARFVRGLDTIEAVHQATLERLHAARQRGRGLHPFYWGAFVVAGTQ